MNGKVCVVTGASAGIGLETALGLGRRGASLHLVCRDAGKAAAAREAVARAGAASVEVHLGDLSAIADVRNVGLALAAALPRVDVLVNNAGAYFQRRTITIDGLEATFATNHLAPFQLTLALREALVAAGGRVLNVSSGAHENGHIDFDDLQRARRYRPFAVYSQSKLANVLFTRELARRWADTSVTAYALHPGVVGTAIGTNQPGPARWLMRLARPLLLKPADGAATTLFLATTPDVGAPNGSYFVKCRPQAVARQGADDQAAARLWEVSLGLLAGP